MNTAKRINNKSPAASTNLVKRAKAIGVEASVINHSPGAYRKHHPCGSTFSPQQCVILNGLRFSIAAGKQYIKAREIRVLKLTLSASGI